MKELFGILVVNEFYRTKKFSECYDIILDAFSREGMALSLFTNAQMYAEIAKNNAFNADFVLFWDKDIYLARLLEQLGLRVFNSSRAIEIADDKALTYLSVLNKLPIPKTLVAPKTFSNIGYTNTDFLSEVVACLGLPIVVKQCFGSFGEQVYLAQSMEQLIKLVKQYEDKPLIFQEFIATSLGRDLRLQVVGGKVITAVKRQSMDGGFRASASLGGKMTLYDCGKSEQEIALKACKIIGIDFAGVDLLYGEDGFLFNEINSNAQLLNLLNATGVNTAEFIAKHIKEIISQAKNR